MPGVPLPADPSPCCPGGPGPRRRLPADERRRAVLDAARHVFAERGYHGAGLADIAAACDCSEPIIYRHFASKQALFAAVLLDAAELLRARLEPHFESSDDPLATLAAVAGAASQDELFIEISRLRMLAVTLASEPEIHEALRRSVAEMHSRLTRVMETARDRGSLAPGVDPAEAAWLWYGVALQAGVRRVLFGTEPPGPAHSTAAALVGLLAGPPPPPPRPASRTSRSKEKRP
jgi:AcrR family transcriptional regulator